MQNNLIITAGGIGSRMGSHIPKQFLELAGKPVIMRSIEVFREFDPNINIVLVLPENQLEYWNQLVYDYNFNIQLAITIGGKTRFHSVKNGLKLIDEDGLVAVHDAVRPLVSIETIDRCFKLALNKGNAIPVTEPVESLRVIDGSGSKAVDRMQYRNVQTPQVFSCKLLKMAYDKEYNTNFTDDASLVEATGNTIFTTAGNIENIKVTTPADLVIAAALLHLKTC